MAPPGRDSDTPTPGYDSPCHNPPKDMTSSMNYEQKVELSLKHVRNKISYLN